MTETREIIGHAQHPPQGPHGSFVPLLLAIGHLDLHVEILRPCLIIGRHTDVDLRLAYPEISRHHCRLLFENGQWRLYDLHSLNGVYLNNVLTVEATLYTGDLLRLGNVQILVKSGTPVRNWKPTDKDQHAKLRQIVELLPSDPSR